MHWLLRARLGTPGACKHHTQVHSSQGGTGGTNSRGMAETFSPLLGWGLQSPNNAVTCRRCFPSNPWQTAAGTAQTCAFLRLPAALAHIHQDFSESGGGGYILSQVPLPTKAEPDPAGGKAQNKPMLRYLLRSAASSKNNSNQFCVAQPLCLLSSVSTENRVSYFENHLQSTDEPCSAQFAAILPSSFLLKGLWSSLCLPVSFWCWMNPLSASLPTRKSWLKYLVDFIFNFF